MKQKTVKLKRGERPADWKNYCPKFKEYYALNNPLWTEEECITAAKNYCKTVNWQCIEYYIKRYPGKSLDELEQMRLNAIKKRKSNSKLQLEYYIKNYPDKTIEECKAMLNKYTHENNSQCIEYYIKRYPDKTIEECKEMLNTAKKITISKQPSYKGENNPNHKSNTTEYERRSRSPKCIEFYQRKFPEATHEEHLNMVKEHINKINIIMQDKTKQVKCVEYWLAKGYSIDEAKNIIKESQVTFTLDYCINKYGFEEGTKVYNDRQERWLKSLRKNFEKYGDNRSPSSEFAYDVISKICNRLCINRPKKEKYMTDIDGSHYSYDFCINKKIIEFNGDYWHMNPSIYKPEDINKTTKRTAQETWDKDNKKKLCAERHGYKVLYIWESEYNKSIDAVIKKCMKFLTL